MVPTIEPWIIEKDTIDPALIAQDWLSIKHTMWNYVGLVRTRQRLHRAQKILRNLQMYIHEYGLIPTLQEDGKITRVHTSNLIKFFLRRQQGDNNAWCSRTEMGCSQP